MSDKLTATSRGNGYYKFPDGLMLCWGQDALSTSSQAKYVNFQQAFVSSPQLIAGWSFNANDNISGDIGALKTSKVTNVNFYFTIGGDLPSEMSGKLYCNWLAIGRWK